MEETNVIMKAIYFHYIFQKPNLKALCGKTHTKALMHHLKDEHVTAKVRWTKTTMFGIFLNPICLSVLPFVTTTFS